MDLLPPLDVCLERVSTRQNHDFTDRDAAKHMWHDFHRTDVDPRHVMNDPEKHVVGRDLTRDEWASYLPDRPYRRTCGDRT